jgi:hypothetical protein
MDSMDILIRADVKNVLHNIVTICILHELERLVHNTTDKVVQVVLDDTSCMPVASNITNAL